MNAFYLVGPSGAGKSALCKALTASDSRFIHVSLDREVKRISPDFKITVIDDWECRWAICEKALAELSESTSPDCVYLIDSGAGALQTDKGCTFFRNQSSRLICLNGNAEDIYLRNQDKFIEKGQIPRSYQEFYTDEYSSHRLSVYEAAGFTIDTTTVSLNESVKMLLAYIHSILDAN
jgi:shikimate kinase